MVCRTPHLPVPQDCLAQWLLGKNSDCLAPDRLWILVTKQRMALFYHWVTHQRLNLVFASRSVNDTSILKCQMAVVTSHFRLGGKTSSEPAFQLSSPSILFIMTQTCSYYKTKYNAIPPEQKFNRCSGSILGGRIFCFSTVPSFGKFKGDNF